MIKNYLRSLKHFLTNIYHIFLKNKKIENINPNETVFVMLAANYSNLGDVAITYAQKKFLGQLFENKKVIEIPVEDTCKVFLDMKKKINKNTIITLIGGGNSGDTYELVERYRRFIIRNFLNNKIVSFPQTCDFTGSQLGKYSLKRSIASYKKNKRLTLVAREKVTYDFYKKNFYNEVFLTPDIVLSLSFKDNINREGICLLLRDDKEKSLSQNNQQKLLNYVNKNFSNVTIKDTCIKDFDETIKYEQLFNLLDEIKSKKLVLTDRLHGMIFCYITRTPCIVFPNNNHKIVETYENWLCECNFIKLIKKFDINDIKSNIKVLYSLEEKIDNNYLDSKLDLLKKILNR